MYLSSKNKAAEILLAIIHCNNCYSVFSLQFLPPWEMHGSNHIWTMTEVGRHPHRSPCPTTLFNQGQLEPAAQFSVQTPFEYLQDGESLTSLGNLCQCLVTLQREGHPVILKAEVATMKLCSCQASDLDTFQTQWDHSHHFNSSHHRPAVSTHWDVHLYAHPVTLSETFHSLFCLFFTLQYIWNLHHFPHMLEDILGTSLILICRSSSSAAVKGAGEDCDIKYFLYPFSETSSWKHNINIYHGVFRIELFFKDFLWSIAKSSCLP